MRTQLGPGTLVQQVRCSVGRCYRGGPALGVWCWPHAGVPRDHPKRNPKGKPLLYYKGPRPASAEGANRDTAVAFCNSQSKLGCGGEGRPEVAQGDREARGQRGQISLTNIIPKPTQSQEKERSVTGIVMSNKEGHLYNLVPHQ